MNTNLRRSLLMFSGGPDSTTLLYELRQSYEVTGICFNYGQDYAEQEIESARYTATQLNLPLEVVDISGLRRTMLGFNIPNGRSLMGGKGCGDPHPLISLAAVYAGWIGAEDVYIAFHKDDVSEWPELPQFVEKLEEAFQFLPITHGVNLKLPYLNIGKNDVLKKGSALGVPLHLTVSCQEGTIPQCGVCSRCQQRRRAFADADLVDLTVYKEM